MKLPFPKLDADILVEKYLLALKCLLAAAALDKENSKVHEQTVRFKLAIDNDGSKLQPKSAELIKSEFNLIPTSATPSQFNDEYLARHKDCARRILSALKVRKLLFPESASASEKDAAAVIKLPSITFEETRGALDLLSSWKSSQLDSFKQAAATKWPKATIFASSS